jgi:hypothetical protein
VQNTPFNRAGRRPAPHPLLAIVPSPTVIYLYFIQSALCRICMCCVLHEYVIIHETSKSTCSVCVGGPGRLPAPTPRSVGEAVGGGRGGWASQVLPGDFEQGRGDLWQASRELKWLAFLASKLSGLFSRVNLVGFHGKIFWRVILAHLFGGSVWRIYLAGFHKQ